MGAHTGSFNRASSQPRGLYEHRGQVQGEGGAGQLDDAPAREIQTRARREARREITA